MPTTQPLCSRAQPNKRSATATLFWPAKFIAHESLNRFVTDWLSVVFPRESFARRIKAAIDTDLVAADGPTADQVDIDAAIAPVLLVWGNYFLPIVFALLGATSTSSSIST